MEDIKDQKFQEQNDPNPNTLDNVPPPESNGPEPEFIPEGEPETLDMSKEADRKIVEDSVKETTIIPFIRLIFQTEAQKEALMNDLGITEDVQFASDFMDIAGAKIIEALGKNPEESSEPGSVSDPAIVNLRDTDLDTILETLEQSEQNTRMRLFLGRVRSDLKELRS